MDAIRGKQANISPKTNNVVVLEDKQQHKVNIGRLLGHDNNKALVENVKTGKIQEWPEKDTLTIEKHEARQEKKLDVASEVIAAQAAINRVLMAENQTLREQLGTKKLNFKA